MCFAEALFWHPLVLLIAFRALLSIGSEGISFGRYHRVGVDVRVRGSMMALRVLRDKLRNVLPKVDIPYEA